MTTKNQHTQAPSKKFMALVRKIQQEIFIYGVVSDKKQALLEQYTDYAHNSYKHKRTIKND